MSQYQTLKTQIQQNIKQNGEGAIRGDILQTQLLDMINALGAGYQFMGVATPTNPGSAQTPDYKCFYIATTPGTYTNLGGLVVNDGEVAILKYDTSWKKEVSGAATVDQVNQLGKYVSSDVYIKAELDKDERVYEAIDVEGNKILFIPQIFKGKAVFEGGVDGVNGFDVESNDEYVFLFKDSSGLTLGGIRKDGQFVFSDGTLSEMWEKIAILIKNAISQYDNNYDVRHIAFGEDNSLSYVVLGRRCDGAKNSYCIGIGYGTLANNTGIKNISVGSNNMENATGHDNTSIGYHASFRNTSGNFNAAVGSESQDDNTEGEGNASIGFCSLQRNNLGDYNVAIGYFALCGGEAEHYEPENLKNVYNNVAIGARALINALTGSNGNVAIGHNALISYKRYENCIAIGEGVDCDKNNQTIIGNDKTEETIVRGDFIVKGADGIKRQIVFNQDGTCRWVAL